MKVKRVALNTKVLIITWFQAQYSLGLHVKSELILALCSLCSKVAVIEVGET